MRRFGSLENLMERSTVSYPSTDLGVTSVRRYDDPVLEHFIDHGRLTAIPVQRKKRMIVLRWLVEEFQPGLRYPEREVNRIITRHHPDFAALRRYLVDEELMQRDHGIYWRSGSLPNVGSDPPSWPNGGSIDSRNG